jgi:dienelactone hydrolase
MLDNRRLCNGYEHLLDRGPVPGSPGDVERSQLRGIAAGVPYVAVAPGGGRVGAPVVLAWPSTVTPASAVAMSSSLPLRGLLAWRVYLDLPQLQARQRPQGGDGAVDQVAQQAAQELPAVLAELRQQVPFEGRPIGLLGASVGAVVAQAVVATELALDVAAMVLVSPSMWRIDRLVERRPRPAVLVVTATDDDERCRDHAVDLWQALSTSNGTPERTALVTVPHTALAAADPARTEAAPTASAPGRQVDAVVTGWFRRHLVR